MIFERFRENAAILSLKSVPSQLVSALRISIRLSLQLGIIGRADQAFVFC